MSLVILLFSLLFPRILWIKEKKYKAEHVKTKHVKSDHSKWTLLSALPWTLPWDVSWTFLGKSFKG